MAWRLVLHERAQERGWPIAPLATGHDATVNDPPATADLLERLSRAG